MAKRSKAGDRAFHFHFIQVSTRCWRENSMKIIFNLNCTYDVKNQESHIYTRFCSLLASERERWRVDKLVVPTRLTPRLFGFHDYPSPYLSSPLYTWLS